MMMYVSSYEDIYHVVLLKLSDGGILRRGFICMVVFLPFTPPGLVKIRIRDDGRIGNTQRRTRYGTYILPAIPPPGNKPQPHSPKPNPNPLSPWNPPSKMPMPAVTRLSNWPQLVKSAMMLFDGT
jgi:hypothetical protein